MPLPNIPAFITPTTLAQILTTLGLDPKLTVAVQIEASAVRAQVVALSETGVLIRASEDEVIHHLTIPVQSP